MELLHLDKNLMTESFYLYLLSINRWLDKIPFNLTYVLKDEEEIKSIFCLNCFDSFIEPQLDFATKESEQNKGYAKKGLKMLTHKLEEIPYIKGVVILPICIESYKICDELKITKKYNIEDNDEYYYLNNPNFDMKYEELEKLLKSNKDYEEIIKYYSGDKKIIKILNNWYPYKDLVREDLSIAQRRNILKKVKSGD